MRAASLQASAGRARDAGCKGARAAAALCAFGRHNDIGSRAGRHAHKACDAAVKSEGDADARLAGSSSVAKLPIREVASAASVFCQHSHQVPSS